MEGQDMFLHNLAVTLAVEAETTCHECGVDLHEDGVIMHLGEAFMLSLRSILLVRERQRKVQP